MEPEGRKATDRALQAYAIAFTDDAYNNRIDMVAAWIRIFNQFMDDGTWSQEDFLEFRSMCLDAFRHRSIVHPN